MKTRLILLMMLMTLSSIVMGQSLYQKKIDKARAGDAGAQADVGYAYETGDGVAKDINQAVYWYRKSAENGNMYGQANLGYWYYQGQGVAKDDNQAFYWNKKAADQGLARAQTWIGYFYEKGIGIEKNYTEMLNWYIKAAAQGDGNGLRNVGICYDNGQGISKDPGKALYYYREALAKGGLSQTNTEWTEKRVKTLTDSGYTAKVDEALQQARSKKQMEEKIGDKQKYDQYIAAARRGDAEAQYEVAMSFNDADESIAWLRKAGEQGHVMSLKILYGIYMGATEAAKKYADPKEASRWLLKWAEQGSVQAMTIAAGCYYTGNGLEQDNEKAMSWARKAVDHYNPDNQDDLDYVAGAEALIGMFYWNGDAGEQNDEQACYWFKKACENGKSGSLLGMAQYWLGKAYYNGEGVQQDYAQAIQLFEKSIANGYKQSESWLERAKKQQIALQANQQQQKIPTENVLPVMPKNAYVINVDENIPQNNVQDTRTYAVIIGNELYENEAEVPFAENDAKVFKDYVQQTLGVPENHIRFIANAGLNRIRGAVRWLKEAMEAQSGQGKIILYYAGHGIPDETNKDAYLLPVDGIGSDVESAYPLNRLYKELSALPAERVTVFLDACFSGAKREGDMMASARGVAIKVKETAPQGKMIVFTAAQGDETAYPFKSQKHGMFTYYLLKKLQETQGNATLGELGDYLTTEVKRQSFVENNKMQTPTIVPSAGLQNTWRGLSLK